MKFLDQHKIQKDNPHMTWKVHCAFGSLTLPQDRHGLELGTLKSPMPKVLSLPTWFQQRKTFHPLQRARQQGGAPTARNLSDHLSNPHVQSVICITLTHVKADILELFGQVELFFNPGILSLIITQSFIYFKPNNLVFSIFLTY